MENGGLAQALRRLGAWCDRRPGVADILLRRCASCDLTLIRLKAFGISHLWDDSETQVKSWEPEKVAKAINRILDLKEKSACIARFLAGKKED